MHSNKDPAQSHTHTHTHTHTKPKVSRIMYCGSLVLTWEHVLKVLQAVIHEIPMEYLAGLRP